MTEFDDAFDPLTIGRRVRSLRQRLGLTLEEFAERIGKAPSQVSVVENGRRELRLSELQQYARALEANVAELLDAAELSEREHLEIALAKLQTTARYQRLSLPHIPARKSLSDDTLHAIVGLFREIERMDTERAATPEQARRANTELRAIMRARSNYFEELEAQATDLRAAIGMPRGPLPQRGAAELASHLGFSLHSVPDLPRSTRSVLDRAHHRLYVPRAQREDGDQRTVVLQALAAQMLEHQAPANYADFLRQRVETNYLTGAILMPEQSCIELLLSLIHI